MNIIVKLLSVPVWAFTAAAVSSRQEISAGFCIAASLLTEGGVWIRLQVFSCVSAEPGQLLLMFNSDLQETLLSAL